MLFELDAEPKEVYWYFAKDDAVWMPPGNQFVSANWVGKDTEAGDLGEQPGARGWRNGSDAKDYLGIEPDCIDPEWFNSGLPSGETTGPWDDSGKLGCCDTPPPVSNLLCDETFLATHPDLVVTINGSGDCGCGSAVKTFVWDGGAGDWLYSDDAGVCGGDHTFAFLNFAVLGGMVVWSLSYNSYLDAFPFTALYYAALSTTCDDTLDYVLMDDFFFIVGCTGTLDVRVTLA